MLDILTEQGYSINVMGVVTDESIQLTTISPTLSGKLCAECSRSCKF